MDSKPTLFVRADAGFQTGSGHLMRCLSLALMLKPDFQIRFLYAEAPDSILDQIHSEGFSAEKLVAEEWPYHSNQGDWVLLDGYHFDKTYQEKIRASGFRLAMIVDFTDREYSADLLINHAPGFMPSDFRVNDDCQFALGPDYALLRPVFLEQARAMSSETEAQKGQLLLCFGGSDPRGLSRPVVNAILKQNRFNRIRVVMGPSFENPDKFESDYSVEPRVECLRSLDSVAMLREMKTAEWCLVPSSGLVFEALSSGSKVMSGFYVDNQQGIYEGFCRLHAFLPLGDFSESALEQALAQVDTWKPKAVIDGNSPERYRNLFRKINHESSNTR